VPPPARRSPRENLGFGDEAEDEGTDHKESIARITTSLNPDAGAAPCRRPPGTVGTVSGASDTPTGSDDARTSAEDAAERAEDAAQRAASSETEAESAEDKAESAEASARAAEAGAESAEAGAESAEAGAESAETGAIEQAQKAQEEAVAVAVASDALLLEETSRRTAAQVSEERPFGVPGRPMGQNSPLRYGFLVTTGGLLAFALGRAIASVEHELLLVLVAAFIAIGLDPVARFLVARGLRRGLAITVIAVVALGAVGGFAAAAAPPLSKEASQLVNEAPRYANELKNKNSTLGKLNLKFHFTEKVNKQVSGGASAAAGGLLQVGGVLVSVAFETVIVFALVIYFLADLAAIKSAFYRLFPRDRRPRVGLLGDEVIARVGGYVLGNVFTSIVAIIGNYIVLLVLNVPYALVLSVLVGVLDLIPLIGSSIGGAIVALVALATVGTTTAIIVVVYHVLYRLFADYLLNPRVLRRTVDVKPVVTVVAVLIGGALLGIIGALIAVPAAAAVQLLLTEIVYPKRDQAPVGA
jgi:predicted PurR-regulated permease PerM